MHIGAKIIKKTKPNVDFLSKEPSPLHYAYSNKKLCGLMIFETNINADKNLKQASVKVELVDKVRNICSKKQIKGFVVLVNPKKNTMIRVKISDESGNIPCKNKMTKRKGEFVNYLMQLSDAKNVIFTQCFSNEES